MRMNHRGNGVSMGQRRHVFGLRDYPKLAVRHFPVQNFRDPPIRLGRLFTA